MMASGSYMDDVDEDEDEDLERLCNDEEDDAMDLDN
jgi:hypothetical protein